MLALTGVVLATTLYYHHYHGYTPLARAFERYQVTPHHRLGAAIAREIPVDAAVSAQPNLNPHVSGRKTLYRFPYIGDAESIFLDLPAGEQSDQYGLIRQLLTGGEFGSCAPRMATRCPPRHGPAAGPDAFFSLPGRRRRPRALPASPVSHRYVFGDALRLVGLIFSTDGTRRCRRLR